MTNPKSPLLLPTRDAINKMAPFIGLNLENIHLVATLRDAASALDDLLRNPYLGFDTESKPTFIKGQKSQGPHVLQFATQQRAYIFQTCHAPCLPAVVEILKSRQIAKIGFGLNDDIKRIAGKFRIQPHGIIDLNHTFKRNSGHKNSVGAKTAVALLFNRRLIKSHKATTSNWSNKVLSENQLLYAANDAFAALAVYAALKKRGIEDN
jgi:ribonuclease D